MKIGNGEFYTGDCLEILSTLPVSSVDLICTDPPYGISFQSSRRIEKYEKLDNDNNLEWLPELVDLCYRVLKDDSAGYFFCSFHNIDIFKQELQKKFTVKNILVWQKDQNSMGDLKGDFAPRCEFIIFVHKGRTLIRGSRDPNVFMFHHPRPELHPTQKPVDLIQYLIEKFSDEGDVVLDPFMGSGTTAIAAENCNRRWIGIEKDETYAATAIERISNRTATRKLKDFFI